MMFITVFDSDGGRTKGYWNTLRKYFKDKDTSWDFKDPAEPKIDPSTTILFLHDTDKEGLGIVPENCATVRFTGGKPKDSEPGLKIYWIQKSIIKSEGPTFKEIQDIVDWVKCGEKSVMPSILREKPLIDHDKVALFIRCWVCKDQDRVNRLKLDKVWLRGEFSNNNPLLSSVCNELSNGSKLSTAEVASTLYEKLEEDIKKNGVDK